MYKILNTLEWFVLKSKGSLYKISYLKGKVKTMVLKLADLCLIFNFVK